MRYQQLFDRLKDANQLAYIPFVLLGDPTEDLSLQLIDTLVENGADALELGFAFSDPVADGPVIQTASLRPLANGFSVQKGFDLVAKVRAKYPDLPIGILTYANLVFAPGVEQFYHDAHQAGIDSVLIADCPVEERELFAQSAKSQSIDSVYIAPPDAELSSLKLIAENSQGYTYVLSRKGITGADNSQQETGTDLIDNLKHLGAPPLVQGFGISKPEHVLKAAQAGVDGIITGSAIVNLINEHYNTPDTMLDLVADYAKTMSNAAHNARHELNMTDSIEKGSHYVDSRNNQAATAGNGTAG
ncbi:tryptophan synthase subunit alpha [Kangiella sp.]|uniref:tryptophan synthase subunit alpha n=1 Tax=Kangiella sp. TaxID=1920245 RepID=UPI003A8E8732